MNRLKWLTLAIAAAGITLGGLIYYLYGKSTTSAVLSWAVAVLAAGLVIEFAFRQVALLQQALLGNLEKTQRQRNRKAALVQIGSRLATARSTQEIADTILNELHQTLGYPHVQLRLDPQYGTVDLPTSASESSQKYITLPVKISGRQLGELTVGDGPERLEDLEELEVLNTIASQAAIGIYNLHQFAEQSHQREDAEERESLLRSRERYLTLLNEITRAGMSVSPLPAMLQSIADHLGGMFSADSALITLWDESRGRPVPSAAYGPLRQVVRTLQIEPGDLPLTASVLKSGRALVIDNADASPYISRRLAVPLQAHSLVALPLIADQQKLGAAILTFRNHRLFTEREVLLGEQAASQIAMAIAKNRALETAQHRAQELAALQKATSALLATLNLDELLGQILDAAMSAIPAAEKGSLHLVARDTGQLQIRAVQGYSDPRIQTFNPTNASSHPARAVHERQPLLVNDAHADPNHHKSEIPELRAIAALIVAPLLLGDKALGAISLESYHRYAFTHTDLNLLVSFAATATTAIRNAQLHAEVQRQATTDALTGAFNRRSLIEMGSREVERARRFHHPLSILMIDADNFKEINDRLGHAAGDRTLARLSAQLMSELRQVDTLARYGGDEFVAMLPETNLERSQQVAERLRISVERSLFTEPEQPFHLTVSVGVATLTYPDETLEGLIERADQALYAAKDAGRNQVALS